MTASSVVINAANQAAATRDQYIEMNGIDTEIYSIGNSSDLTAVGEVSNYATRKKRSIKLLPAFKTSYTLLPVGVQGRVNELREKQVFHGYVKTTENINKGDILKIVYSFAENTVDVKYFEVQEVEIRGVLVIIGKKLVMTTYTAPISSREIEGNIKNFATVYPETQRDFY